MSKASNKSIVAIVENLGFDEKSPWDISTVESGYIEIRSSITDEEIGSVMLKACLSGSNDLVEESASETLKAFIANKGFVLSGGLLFTENDKIKVGPGCCCGLENWHEWLEVPSGKHQIWTGHDPESLIEINDGTIKIWQDRDKKDEEFSIEFTVDEMNEKLAKVERNLKDFLFRLGQWTKYIEPSLENQVVKHFAENMNINI